MANQCRQPADFWNRSACIKEICAFDKWLNAKKARLRGATKRRRFMTSQEFLQEVLNSDICPENFEEIYRDFQRFQQAAIDTLNEFHRVCEMNGIHYQLAHGSLLGAIRDDGQIPWDYDVDVMVPIWERDRLIEALKNDLNENFYFFCPEVDSKCRHTIMRIAPKGYSTEVLHVDVFYYTASSENEEERKQHQEEILRAVRMRHNKLLNCREKACGNCRTFFALLLKRKLRGIFVSLKKAQEAYDQACWKYPYENAKYYVSLDIFKRVYPAENLNNTILYKSQSGTHRISANYEDILRYRYGEYKKVFPLENRLKEMMRSYQKLKYHHNDSQ